MFNVVGTDAQKNIQRLTFNIQQLD